jgi:penicillin-binding protein 1C
MIAFPPNGARVELTGDGEPSPLALKAMGGAPPFTWLADGVPIATAELRRQAAWERPSRGFARLSVVDAKGATATAVVRID